MQDKSPRSSGLIVGGIISIIFVFSWLLLIVIALIVGTGPWEIPGIVIVFVVGIFFLQHIAKSFERRGYSRPSPAHLLVGALVGAMLTIAVLYAAFWLTASLAAR